MIFRKALKVFFILVTLIFFMKCQTDQKNENQNSKTSVISIKGKSILATEYAAIDIDVIDTLILLGLNGDDYFFHIYNAISNEFVGQLGKRGNSPKEWSAPIYSGQYIKTDTSILIWVNDIFKYRFMLVDLTQSIEQNKTVLVKEYSLSPSLYLTHDLLYINDFTLVGNLGMDAFDRGRLCFVDIGKDKVKISELFPEVDNQNSFNSYDLYQLYFDQLRISPDRSKIVSAMNMFDRIDVFDTTGNLLNSIVGLEVEIDGIKNKKNGEFVDLNVYYQDLYLSDCFFYALYYNQLSNNYGDILKPTEIYVFDYSGNQLFNLKTDDYLMSISVDEKNGFLYGIDYFNEKILQYDIRDIYTDNN